jgi:peptidyl-dipeptidase Dcp
VTNNPLLQPWTAPYSLPPFDAIRPEHFEPAFEAAMREHRGELRTIGEQAEAPSFDNTLAAFGRSGRRLARISLPCVASSRAVRRAYPQPVTQG